MHDENKEFFDSISGKANYVLNIFVDLKKQYYHSSKTKILRLKKENRKYEINIWLDETDIYF
jgi:hypothetical protein